MTPKRTGGDTGRYQFDRVFTIRGQRHRCQRSSGARTKQEFHRRDGLLTKLFETGNDTLLLAFLDGDISMRELVDADRRNELAQTAAGLYARRNLWTELDRQLPAMGNVEATRIRYRTSQRHLKRSKVLPDHARVSDLATVDWRALQASWDGGPSDWNHLRRMVSRFLSLTLGSKFHPLRHQIVEQIPIAREVERVPDVSAVDFLKAVNALEPLYRPQVMLRAITGLRNAEAERLSTAHLRPARFEIAVPGTKTLASSAIIAVDPRLWPWVIAAVQTPVKSDLLRAHWYKAVAAAELAPIRLHDLRHCFGQWLAQGGRHLGSIQGAMRHASSAMTMRYIRQLMRSEDALVLGDLLAPKATKKGRKRA